MENEEFLCLLPKSVLVPYLSHRVDDEALSWLIAKNKYCVIAELIIANKGVFSYELVELLDAKKREVELIHSKVFKG